MSHVKNGFTILVVLLASTGCQPPVAQKNDPAPPVADFRPAEAGSIHGRVSWVGDIPVVEPIKLLIAKPGDPREHPNPNAPRIDSKSNGIAGTLVALKDVDPARSRPWPHDPVDVVFEAGRLEVRQGERTTPIGLVRKGDTVSCRAKEAKNHILVGRGASDFSLPLFVADAVTRRKLDQPGIVELSSGAGVYWLRRHLFVSDNPYSAVTAADGTFELPQVPAGTYELALWSPNWHIVRHERNPEFSQVERLVFAPAVQKTQRVTVTAGEDAAVYSFELSAGDFPAK